MRTVKAFALVNTKTKRIERFNGDLAILPTEKGFIYHKATKRPDTAIVPCTVSYDPSHLT